MVAVDTGDGSVGWHIEEVPAFPWAAPALIDGTLYVVNRYEAIVAIR